MSGGKQTCTLGIILYSPEMFYMQGKALKTPVFGPCYHLQMGVQAPMEQAKEKSRDSYKPYREAVSVKLPRLLMAS
jgi:hypothetical protein